MTDHDRKLARQFTLALAYVAGLVIVFSILAEVLR